MDGEKIMDCPLCGKPMVLRQSRFGKFYGCSGYPQCKTTHGAHPDGKPLGIPADKETRDLRIKAHELLNKVFDYNTKDGRRKMYSWLKWNTTEGHISMLDKYELLILIEVLNDKVQRL